MTTITLYGRTYNVVALIGSVAIIEIPALDYGTSARWEVRSANGDRFRSPLVFRTLAGARRKAEALAATEAARKNCVPLVF